VSARYDLLIGADGTQSAVRAAMGDADPGFSVDIADSGREWVAFFWGGEGAGRLGP
jgi:2-polyprenyl-6-methoxyphenol hydroxylase-like FAD-dependent oxidoreductase